MQRAKATNSQCRLRSLNQRACNQRSLSIGRARHFWLDSANRHLHSSALSCAALPVAITTMMTRMQEAEAAKGTSRKASRKSSRGPEEASSMRTVRKRNRPLLTTTMKRIQRQMKDNNKRRRRQRSKRKKRVRKRPRETITRGIWTRAKVGAKVIEIGRRKS